METPLTPRVLGYLIEKGYTYMLASSQEDSDTGFVTITLRPVKQKPDLEQLPEAFETYYPITQEPLQMVCGIDQSTKVIVDFLNDTDNKELLPDDLLEDNNFRLSEDFYKQVIESLEEYAVFTTDKIGDVSSWNRGAERLLGYTEKEIIGTNAKVFFTEKDQQTGAHNKELKDAIDYGKAIDERFHVRKDKSVFWGSGLVFPLLDRKNIHRGFTKIMRNLEERRDAEKHRPETRI